MHASERIDEYIAKPKDWRTPVMARLRELIREAAPEASEEWKWNSPTWSHCGLLVSVGAFKKHVGVNFFQGASLPDEQRMFNSGLEAKHSRSMNIYQGDLLDESAFRALVRAAAAHNEHSGAR